MLPTHPRYSSMFRFALLLGLIFGVLAGCKKKTPDVPPAKPPLIQVSHLVEREVTDFVDYTGRTDAVQSVSVRARVTGFLTRMPFEEGAEVQEGDLLFEIDPRPYQSLVDSAQAQVVLNQTSYNLAKMVYDRDVSAKGVISQLQIDQDKAAVEEADARTKAAQAMLESAKLNLSYTQVHSTMRGRISRYYYPPGNLVTQDQTLLTTIVGMDYIYAYFDIEERTYQRIVKGLQTNKIPAPLPQPQTHALMAVVGGSGWRPGSSTLQRSNLPVKLAAEGEVIADGQDPFPHLGKLDFINNQVNPSTGTVAVRAVFHNSRTRYRLTDQVIGTLKGAKMPDDLLAKLDPLKNKAFSEEEFETEIGKLLNADEKKEWENHILNTASTRPRGLASLIPGMFVRVRFPLGGLYKAQLVIDRAIGSDQGLKYVYVVDSQNKVQYRRVITGALQEDGLRVIEPYKLIPNKDKDKDKDLETGVKPDEWVVVGGLQQLRPRVEIQPEQITMPTLAGGDSAPRRKGGEKKQ
jgi:RND family efflux transporter MFP subunit